MDLIVVSINKNDDWNLHKRLVESIEDYEFITIFDKGTYDTRLDKNYYIIIENDIIIPLKKNEYDDVIIKFFLYDDRAIIRIFIKDNKICEYNLKVYDKKSYNIDKEIKLIEEKN